MSAEKRCVEEFIRETCMEDDIRVKVKFRLALTRI